MAGAPREAALRIIACPRDSGLAEIQVLVAQEYGLKGSFGPIAGACPQYCFLFLVKGKVPPHQWTVQQVCEQFHLDSRQVSIWTAFICGGNWQSEVGT